MAQHLLGIDSGLTVTKAVVFNADGRQLGVGAVSNEVLHPQPRWVERDMDALWTDTQEAIRTALSRAGVRGDEIRGIGVTGHGDGVYLVDEAGRPVRPGINSLDSRAQDVVERWAASDVVDRSLQLLGQAPFAALSPALLAWFGAHDPEVLAATRWVLYCKDWIRYRLTGEIATDPTEASAGFTDVRTQQYTPEALPLFGLEGLGDRLPPVVGASEVAGEVTAEVAEATGLTAGTPVATGVHDVDASAIGTGVIGPGTVCAITGTWSINEVITGEPTHDERWACRTFAVPGQYLCQAASPASSTNLEWFVQQLCPLEVAQAEQQGVSPYDFVNDEVAGVLQEESRVVYHPFLYGAPGGAPNPAAFIGVRGWTTRAHLLRALFEGVVFNHRTHIADLRSHFDVASVRLTGGGSRSELWCQLYADALSLPVEVTDAEEAGALGAALCGGVATGLYRSLPDAVGAVTRVERSYQPDSSQTERLDAAYERYRRTVAALAEVEADLG